MTTAHAFTFAKLGEPGDINLSDYAGKAVLIVNVASACGFTPQYRELESLYESKAAKGLVVLHDDADYELAARHLPDVKARRVVSAEQ